MQYGVLCLLPPAAMLIFALKTKKSFEALIFGTLVAYLIMYKTAFIGPWCDLLLSEISNADNQYILLLCGLFGGFIFLLREAKGTLGFSNLLSRFCKNERITIVHFWMLRCLLFLFQIGIGIFHFSELWHQFAGKQNDNQKCSHGIKHIRKHF